MPLDTRQEPLLQHLDRLQQAMMTEGLWSANAPDEKALLSTQPFCLDTLDFEQWLQFVMIPQFRLLVVNNMALPEQCQVANMAEEAFKHRHAAQVLKALVAIDQLFGESQY